MEKVDLQKEQILCDDGLWRHVGNARQWQHRVGPTGLQEATRKQQRVGRDNVVVREPMNQQQRPL
jgi:hypothetical protein